MAKYSLEFKLKLVEEYLRGEGGYKHICNKHSVSSAKVLQRWVAAYNTLGIDGLMRSRKNQTYTFEFKLNVVELYLTTEVSYQDLALRFEIKNPAMLCNWVNDYRIVGPDALKPKTKGRPTKMSKPSPKQPKEKKINPNPII